MPTPRELAVADLRRSIDVLPERTRNAMLIGISNNTVITGAFVGGDGVCPMMAAHRAGGRTSCVSFPEAWDRFTGVYGRGICRQATEYEVALLRAEIEASLQPQQSDLAEAIAEHTAMVEGRRRRARHLAGEPVDLGEAIHEHEAARRRRRFSGSSVDLGAAIEDYKSSARRRRSDEATEIGLDWLFEETLVLPEDFGTTAPDPDFDFDAVEDDIYAR